MRATRESGLLRQHDHGSNRSQSQICCWSSCGDSLGLAHSMIEASLQSPTELFCYGADFAYINTADFSLALRHERFFCDDAWHEARTFAPWSAPVRVLPADGSRA
jgi:hypothetical protein